MWMIAVAVYWRSIIAVTNAIAAMPPTAKPAMIFHRQRSTPARVRSCDVPLAASSTGAASQPGTRISTSRGYRSNVAIAFVPLPSASDTRDRDPRSHSEEVGEHPVHGVRHHLDG